MTSRKTQVFSKSANKTNDGETAPAYTLEFLTPTPKHPQGSFETIELPYIEIGRENCLINYGSDVPTVSRKHAAILRMNKETIIKNLSKTNPTLVNGKPVIDQYYLNSGDEIQLSLEGPKLRFNEIKSQATKVPLTNRLNLAVKQSINPYKRALLVIGVILLLAIIVGGVIIYKMQSGN